MELHCMLVSTIVLAFLAANSAVYGCGTSPLRPPWGRIVGGSKVQRCSDIPWQVWLLFGPMPGTTNRYKACGGSIISSRHILTAAHCTDGWRPSQVKVKVGITNKSQGQFMDASNIHQHQEYVAHTKVADIAIVTLRQPLRFNDCVQPICLQNSFSLPSRGQKCLVSGFGAIYWQGPSSADLKMTWVNTNRGRDCARYVASQEKMVCGKGIGTDSCQGDSGGPLVCRGQDGSYVQVGVVSHGKECAHQTYPGIYTDVQHYHQWIQQKMRY